MFKKRNAILLCLVGQALVGCKNNNMNGMSGGVTPAIFSVSPAQAPVGNSALTVTLTGSDFVAGAVVRLNGAARNTTFQTSNRLAAQFTGSDLATAGSFPVTVSNPGGDVSNAVNFIVGTVTVPTVTSLVPASATAGGPAFALTVNGLNFGSATKVTWNGLSRSTSFVSARVVTATIPATDIASAGTVQVSVTGATTGLPFTISPLGPVQVTLQNFMFSPHDVTVAPGQTVTYSNRDGATSHTVNRDVTNIPGPDVTILNGGQSYSFTVPTNVARGTNIFYHCNFHGAPGDGTTFGAGMSGVLRVR